MTSEELQAGLERLSGIVDRFIDAGQERLNQHDEGLRQLQQAQLGTTAHMGMVIQTMREGFQSQGQLLQELIQTQRELRAGYEQQQAMLRELIRQRQPPQNEGSDP